MTTPQDLECLTSLASVGGVTPEGSALVDGRTISWRYTSDSKTIMEVSASSRKAVYWSGWEWDTESMNVTWIGIGNPTTQRATVSISQTSYVKENGSWRLSSMNLRKGLPIGENSKFSLLDMVKEGGFNQN